MNSEPIANPIPTVSNILVLVVVVLVAVYRFVPMGLG